MNANVFAIQRFCTHDGPGIRTTVFFKGCQLRCAWCHNPESQAPQPQIFYAANLCVGCGACVAVCPKSRHLLANEQHIFQREYCTRCMVCARACPTGALQQVGTAMSVEEILREVERDRAYYECSGGGITLSGGEPFAQPAPAIEILKMAKQRGIHTAVQTCGAVSIDTLRAAAPFVDLFLWDIKDTDPARHLANTCAPLDPILDNLHTIAATNANIIIRAIIVPHINDSAVHRHKLGQLGFPVQYIPYRPLEKPKHQLLGQ